MSITPSALAIEQSGAFEIIGRCSAGAIPANADIGAAIAAHRMAFRDDPELAHYVLRVVLLAATKTREQVQRKTDYFNELPLDAWTGWATADAASVREMALAECAWLLTRMVDT